jgi:hypothetical protein
MMFILTNLSALLQFDGFCFAFVEYESRQSMQASIEVSLLFSISNHFLCDMSFSPPCAFCFMAAYYSMLLFFSIGCVS